MVIRPEKPLVVTNDGPASTWELINQTQKPPHAGWLIPQPAHSALAGEIAAKLSPGHFPGLTDKVLRCISLHDAGWAQFDAHQIAEAHGPAFRPASFVTQRPAVFLSAWLRSIETAEKICPEGGYMVSRHFESLGKQPLDPFNATEESQLEQFKASENQRQKRLAATSGKSHEELEALLQANRFCDLLSLFLCANIELQPTAAVHFLNPLQPQEYTMIQDGEEWVFEGATPFKESAALSFSGVAFGGKRRGGGWFSAVLR